jgi:NADPH-dependent 2,4-dienoyl-CoA reductase/sulfur reductase-like enzyme
VGAGIAGLRAAEACARAGKAAGLPLRLTVLGGERDEPYVRTALSKEALLDDAATVSLPVPPALRSPEVAWRLGVAATAVDTAAQVVHCADGSVLPWDGLVVAPGLDARTLPGPADAPVQTLRTLADARALRQRLQRGTRVVVVGAGFLGCEIALAAARRGAQVELVTEEATPWASALGTQLGDAVRALLQRQGVQVRALAPVLAAWRASPRDVVQLADGTTLEADLVVAAIGSRPHPHPFGELVGDADGRWVGHPAVVVAGDAALLPVMRADGNVSRRRIEHWTWAADTGRLAGRTLAATLTDKAGVAVAGSTALTTGVLPSFWCDLHHRDVTTVQVFGVPADGLDDVRPLEGRLGIVLEDAAVAIGYHRDDVLVGVAVIGLPARLRHYRSVLTPGASGGASRQRG